MDDYPIALRLAGSPCLVVGGGAVAERKVRGLLDAGAAVTVVSPEITDGLSALANDGHIRLCRRPYRDGDLDNVMLACVAVDAPKVGEAVAADARRTRTLLNVADRPSLCDFVLPSVARRGGLVVAVSTGGRCPAFARHVRQRIETVLEPQYEVALEILSRLREYLKRRVESSEDRGRRVRAVIEGGLTESLRVGEPAVIDRLLARHAGPEVSLAVLGVGVEQAGELPESP